MTAVDPQTTRPVAVGPDTDLMPGEGRAYALGNKQVAVFRMTDGTLRATSAVCPHKAGPLADGQFDLGKVVCPLHQYAFSFATGTCSTDGIGTVETYRADDRDGQIVVWV
ncbi:Rieske (2Fe-2S) protein [Gordonia desulfuricans]|uniref:Rieske (2Fe-2S) protein n=1 Tax=Gordonia desulfuricans TaxID=89051 RepID=A0A7K3LKF2_9ACTN|nr:Rieske (2Fe-2S) protein [Gordonia desulfuricans]NDK88704.1 Rieske (2Fe-2S) protein [Gordonia desulfuricans]